MSGPLALSQAINRQAALSTVTVLAAHLDYAGKCAATVVTGTERHGERLAFAVTWLEVVPFAKVPRRLRRALETIKGADVTFLAEVTKVGAPGLQTLAADVGQYPLSVVVSGDVTHTESDPMHLSNADLMGAVQSAAAGGRLEVPGGLARADELLSAIKGLEMVDGKFIGGDSAVLRAVALGLWFAGLSLGDAALGDPAPVEDDKECALKTEADERGWAREQMGIIEHWE